MLPEERLPVEAQPLPAVDPPPAVFQQPQRDFQKPTCSPCGLAVPGRSLSPVSQSLKQLQSSSLQSSQSSNRSRGDVSGPHRPAATPHDLCFHLLLACLWCRCSVLLLGLLEACSGCLQGLCSSCCCRACARCCSEVQDTPMEELNCHAHCHSVLFQSCCEPTECLEFCLDCCEICHRN